MTTPVDVGRPIAPGLRLDADAARLVARLRMRHLRLLDQLGAERSLTRVADRIGISQSAVSHALAELEELFGQPLFIRAARGIAPTATGLVAIERSRAMLRDLENWVDDLQAISSGRAGHLRVGIIPFIPARLLADAIRRTGERGYPVTLTIEEQSSDHLLARLKARELDLVIGRASAVLPLEGLVHEILYDQTPRLIAHRRLAQRLNRRPLAWAALADLQWVLGRRQTPMREQIVDLFLRAGVRPPTPMIESLSTRLIGELIATDERLVSIVPSDVADELARIAGIGIVTHAFDWTLPPVAVYRRFDPASRPIESVFAAALSRESPRID